MNARPSSAASHRQQGHQQVAAGVVQARCRRGNPDRNGAAAEELLGDDVGDHRRQHHGEQRLDRELAQDELQPEEHAGDRGVERGRDPAARAAGDQDPQPVLRHAHHWPRLDASAEPICTIGPSRPTDPPVPMHSAEAIALTALTCGRIRPPLSATAIITSGTPCPRASRA